MLPTVMKVARILGPKGMMPNVKTGTLVDGKDIGAAVKNCLQSVPFKIEKNAGLLNMSLGTVSKYLKFIKILKSIYPPLSLSIFS